MYSKIAFVERQNFSDRLKQTLAAAGYSLRPSAFTKEFNLRADGAMVTVHAARKWLYGEAIPTQEKIHILARWLGIPASWLRFGDAENGMYALAGADQAPDSKDLLLLHDVRLLPAEEQQVVRELVTVLLRRCHGESAPPPRKK
jgi:transcriptional regulator with XRE-family HTH domain